MSKDKEPIPLFLPPPTAVQASPAFRFLRKANSVHSLHLQSYLDLYRWSTTDLDAFWSLVWDETGVIGDKGDHVVDNSALPPDNPVWYVNLAFSNLPEASLIVHRFADARVNWAENMLRCRSENKLALVEASPLHIYR